MEDSWAAARVTIEHSAPECLSHKRQNVRREATENATRCDLTRPAQIQRSCRAGFLKNLGALDQVAGPRSGAVVGGNNFPAVCDEAATQFRILQ